jgi:hydroxymethylpyrimidine/phosphomethylpyrimidine kinase
VLRDLATFFCLVTLYINGRRLIQRGFLRTPALLAAPLRRYSDGIALATPRSSFGRLLPTGALAISVRIAGKRRLPPGLRASLSQPVRSARYVPAFDSATKDAPAMPPRCILTFAASDPSGGAGIQADLLTIAALGCHPLSVVTALTVQDTVGVSSVQATEAALVEAQARTILANVAVAAFKVGLIGSAANVAVIAAIAADYPEVPLVFDPVLASGRGDELAGAAMIAAMRERLLPRTTVATPNSLEARRLADAPDLPLAECARRLLALGCGSVLITGTHEETPQVVNALYGRDGLVRSENWPRLPGSYHGSGCTLASALAAHLALGLPLAEAVHAAQDYAWKTLAAGFSVGRGQFIPDRFFAARSGQGQENV